MLTSPHAAAAAPLTEAVITTATCCSLQIPLLWILTGTTYISTDIRPLYHVQSQQIHSDEGLISSVANNGHYSLLALCIVAYVFT